MLNNHLTVMKLHNYIGDEMIWLHAHRRQEWNDTIIFELEMKWYDYIRDTNEMMQLYWRYIWNDMIILFTVIKWWFV